MLDILTPTYFINSLIIVSFIAKLYPFLSYLPLRKTHLTQKQCLAKIFIA